MYIWDGASAAATSVALPTHQAGDLLLVFARGTAAAPSVPAAGGSVPAWTTLQSGFANSLGLTVVGFIATGSAHISGVFTNATHIGVLVIRPDTQLLISPARSSVGNANNTQTIVYPALTFADLSGNSRGFRIGTRTVADSELANAPSGWTNYLVQPAGASALLTIHNRTAVTASPTADSVAATGTNAAYRAVTIEVQEIWPQTKSTGGVSSAQAFGTVVARASQKVSVPGVPPPGYVLAITNKVITNQSLVRGTRKASFGAVTATIVVTTRVDVAGVGSPQAFGVVTVKTATVKPVAGVGSAQAFGALTIKGILAVAVTGVPSAQAFGITAPKASIKVLVAGIPSAQAFGAITVRTGFSKPVPGLTSAQAFGAIKAIYLVHAPGLGSPMAFGVVQWHATITIPVAGIGSAQAFGSATVGLKVRNVWIWPTTYFPSTGGALTGEVTCGDGHTVGGWDYLPAAGRATAVELEPHEVSTLDLEPTLVK